VRAPGRNRHLCSHYGCLAVQGGLVSKDCGFSWFFSAAAAAAAFVEDNLHQMQLRIWSISPLGGLAQKCVAQRWPEIASPVSCNAFPCLYCSGCCHRCLDVHSQEPRTKNADVIVLPVSCCCSYVSSSVRSIGYSISLHSRILAFCFAHSECSLALTGYSME